MTAVTDRLKAAWIGLRGGPLDRGPMPVKAARAASRDVRLWPDYRNAQPLWSMTDIQTYIDYGFSLNAVIYAACMYRADAVITAQLCAYRGDADSPEPLDFSDPLGKLLLRPNRFQSAHEFHALNSVFFGVAGQSYIWFKRERPSETPSEMYALRPDWVKIVPRIEKNGEVIGYVYTPQGKTIKDGYPLLPEDVMHVKRPNPGDPLMGAGYGFSPLGPAAQSANVDNDVTKFLKVFFQSGAMFQNMVTFDVPMEQDDLARVRERLKEIYGGVGNWNEWGVLDQGAKFNRVSPTFDEMGFDAIDSRNEARILMSIGVPPILVGSRFGLERSTYSNYEEARRAFWEDRLLPELRMFEGEFNYFLSDEDRFVRYDLSDVPALRQDVPALVTAAKVLMDMGVPTRLALNAMGVRVESYDGDMERYINTGGGNVMTPVAVAATADQAVQNVEDQVTTAPNKARATKAYDAAAMGRKMDTLATNWEQRYGEAAVELFKQEQRDISAMLTEMQKAAYRQKATPNWTVLQQMIEEWYAETQPGEWRSAFVPLIEGTMIEAGKEWASALGVTWDVRNLQGEQFFQEYLLTFADPITETSAQAVKDVLAQAMAEGWTIPQTEDRLGQVFDQWMQGDLTTEDFEWFEQRLPPYRRETIARTESIRSASQGTLELGKSWSAKRKFWIATGDDRTRDSHVSAGRTYDERGAIPIDEPFIVGGVSMNAPGDPSAPVAEIANCRCTPGLLMD